MSSLTDRIERTILDLIEEQDGACEIGRNAFAAEMQVAPSQITYVISTRFSHRHGYLVESRRGGSGYVRIRRVPYSDEADQIMYLVRSLADSLSQHDAAVLVKQLLGKDLLSRELALLMKAALSDASLRRVDRGRRDQVRSDMFRNMLIRIAALAGEEEAG